MCEQVVVVALAWLSAVADVAAEPRVSITGHRAAVARDGDQVGIEVGITARSTLPVPVSEIEVGILYAAQPEALGRAEPAKLYARGPRQAEGVGVLVRRLSVQLGPLGEASATFIFPLSAAGPTPKTFQTHLLGYTLADAPASLLLELLTTSAASDEVAACQAFALLGDASAKRAARRRWAGRGDPVTALARRARAGLPEKVTQEEAFARVYAVLALGVLGGEQARQALAALSRQTDLDRLDEPLQVLRVARLVGSARDTPLAFALTAEARTMGGVVAAALAELEGLSSAPPEPPPAPAPAAAPPLPAEQQSAADSSCSVHRAGVLGCVTAMLLAGLLAWRRQQGRRRPRP